MHNFLKTLTDHFSCDLAIDLGSTNTLIYRKGCGIIVNEPTLVAQERASRGQGIMLGAGKRAKELSADRGKDVVILKPVQYGVVADLPAAREMLIRYLAGARSALFWREPRVIVNVPVRASRLERDLFRRLILSAGAREVYLIEEPRAVAIGAGLDLSEERHHMVVDIGGGITEMAVIAEGKIVRAAALRTGGEHMDQAIAEHVERRHSLRIEAHDAEKIKMQIGDACPGASEKSLAVTELNLAAETPRTVRLTPQEIREALAATLKVIISSIKAFLQSLSPQQSVDIIDHCIVLAGGGALLGNMDRLLERELLYPVVRVRDPLTCVVRGSGDALQYLEHYRSCGK
jgi:rod shape-determining protein MreB